MTNPTSFVNQYEGQGKVIAPDINVVTKNVGPAVQTSTSAFVAVAGSQMNTALALLGTVLYRITETGGVNGITVKLQGSVDGTVWYDIKGYDQTGTVEGDTTIAIAASGTAYVGVSAAASNGILAAARYYQIVVEDTSGGSHGQATVVGYAS